MKRIILIAILFSFLHGYSNQPTITTHTPINKELLLKQYKSEKIVELQSKRNPNNGDFVIGGIVFTTTSLICLALFILIP